MTKSRKNPIMKRALFVMTVVLGAALNASPLDDAFHSLYDCDFEASRAAAQVAIDRNPEDPMGHAARAASYLFGELHRLNLLGKEFLTSDARIRDKRAAAAQKEHASREFHEAAATARRLALRHLAASGDDRDALLAMTIVAGMERDYAALIEKRLRASLDCAKESQQYARKLIAADPTQYDAYFTFGFSEYLVGSLPFFARWFMRLDGIDGDKEKGLRELEIAAAQGRFLKPFAKMMLAMFYLREKRPADSRRHLQSLASEFPGNPAVRAELRRMDTAAGGTE